MNEEHEERGELVPIGGLWSHDDRGGRFYLSGYLGDALLFVFANTFKKPNDKQPDYRMYVGRKRKPEQTQPSVGIDSVPQAPKGSEDHADTTQNGSSDNLPF